MNIFKRAIRKLSHDNKCDNVPELEAPYKPSIQSITDAGIECYWKKPEQSSGYEIYRSYEKGERGELVKVITNKLLGVWTDSGFDRDRRHIYYSVRSFYDEGSDERRYSAFTEQFEAAFRENMELEREVTFLHSGSSRVIMAFYGWGQLKDAIWTSSDESVAVIDQQGLITGIAKGECTITCESPELGCSVSSRVVIDRSAPEPLTEITSRYSLNEETGIWEYNNPERHDGAVIMMTGDMMCGKGQIEKQYSEEIGWNFNPSFDFVREVTAESDFTIGNLETLLDPAWPYMTDEWFIKNISNCNAPPRYLDAIKYGGFDGVIVSNNHNCDGGVLALKATLDQIEHYKLPFTGAFRNSEEKRYMILSINGIKVGFVAYMSLVTGYNGKDRRWSKEEKRVLLNNYSDERAQRDIDECRKAGAEYVIAYMHWGQKNYRNPTDEQVKEARGVADAGADFIVGSNPHVLEKYDVIDTSDGRKVPCYYSVGNFHARMNQVKGNRDSVIVRIYLTRDETGKVVLTDNSYIPFFTYSSFEGSYLAPVSVLKRYHEGKERKGRVTKLKRIKEAIGEKGRVFE